MNRCFAPRAFNISASGGVPLPNQHFPEAFFLDCMSEKVYEGIEIFVKGLEKDGKLSLWERRRKRKTAKSERRRIMKAVNETLAEMEAER